MKKKQRHPGNQSWGALGGFKYAKLDNLKTSLAK